MKKLTLILSILLMVHHAYSRRSTNTNKGVSSGANAAGCASATAKATLELNNVRTRIEATGGSMWQDRANGIADYEVPKRGVSTDPKFTSIFAGSLWMGGQDVNGQLKVAAVTFRTNGNDFWPGPLNTSTAEIDAPTCTKYDQFYGVSRAMVDEFVAWYQAGIDDAANGTSNQINDFPGYSIPSEILNWPAHGDLTLGQDWHLAPFYDRDGDDFYDPNSGDYPKYDLIGDIDCRTTRDVRLFGDTTIWFVFNDKGNTHTESQGPSIGMEIRGQAFAFATNDEVNNMTFYNYEMINRSTFTLTETYFGQWVDADLGGSNDDYVGCDASRGLGYCYNGDNNDENSSGTIGYGAQPPAIGVDFFEGPYADNDGLDNPLTEIVQDAIDSNGIPYAGLGIGYGDGIVDNERYGMRKFVFYNNAGGNQGDPQSALEHYNYLRGIWRDGSNMVWGGTGHISSGGTTPADLLFPGNSDPLFWSTQGVSVSPTDWSEYGEGNTAADRRFLESAGPFTLEPGAVNDLTVGVVWARTATGDNFASVSALQLADDKAQALFDNCFKIAEGPDAPDVTFQELNNELILYLSNRSISNNSNESYNQKNPFIAIPDTLDGVYQGTDQDKDTLKFYKFQGYQIYQVKNGLITVSELDDPSKARLAAQVDLKDDVTRLINYTFNEEWGANVPKEMVNGKNEGIKHSFRFTTDLFATGDNSKLINHKTYYYMAIAYGYNEYKHYDPLNPLGLDGQTQPYIASRKLAGGQGITSFSAIPHNPAPENGGTIANSKYGDMPQITRIEGQGNGGNDLELTAESEAYIVSNNFMDFPTYKSGHGPITVKVIDPLNVQAGVYTVKFRDSITSGNLNDAYWTLKLPTPMENGIDTINSDQLLAIENEQLFLKQGLSITVKQTVLPGVEKELGNGAIGSSVEYADSTMRWLGGYADREGQTDGNWIRSGSSEFDVGANLSAYNDWKTVDFLDPEQSFEGFVNKTWAPFGLVSYIKVSGVAGEVMQDAVGPAMQNGRAMKQSFLSNLASVDIVFTSDKSKWSRCMVLEAQSSPVLATGNAKHLELRKSNSVDKNGNDDGTGTGMGWFPGYAINVETGERLNIAFAEDSWLAGENGKDMRWNPTANAEGGVPDFPNGPLDLFMGGKHYVYVFRSTDAPVSPATVTYPSYDGCAVLAQELSLGTGTLNELKKAQAFSSCIWAGVPMLEPGHNLFETDAKVKLRVEKPYKALATASTENGTLPMYRFDMTGLEVELGNSSAMDSALAMINVVPNPYYAYSEYETGQLDNKIKIVNLPQKCTISIYNVNGTLMRRFQKDDETTSLDWDLKNFVDIPVASGVYLMHVKVPDVGERTLKWFGIMKPTDLNSF
jgi:hypothetical protein